MNKPRVLITVTGGVAEYWADPGVDVLLIDYDNAEEAGEEPEIPEEFGHLLEPDPELRALLDGTIPPCEGSAKSEKNSTTRQASGERPSQEK